MDQDAWNQMAAGCNAVGKIMGFKQEGLIWRPTF